MSSKNISDNYQFYQSLINIPT